MLVIIEIKGTDWDSIPAGRVMRNLRRHLRQLQSYLDTALQDMDVGGWDSAAAALLYRPPGQRRAPGQDRGGRGRAGRAGDLVRRCELASLTSCRQGFLVQPGRRAIGTSVMSPVAAFTLRHTVWPAVARTAAVLRRVLLVLGESRAQAEQVILCPGTMTVCEPLRMFGRRTTCHGACGTDRVGEWKAGVVSQRWTARAIASAVRSGARTATEFTEHALAGIEALDPVLHFTDLLAAGPALTAARRIDAVPPGQRGALAGVPFLAKKGTTAASPVVRRLAAAGAVLLGTSTRPDPAAVCQAWGWNGRDHTRNPWNTALSSGGSSAGAAAAVAAGVVPLATGGDSAGSLRIPAAFCGVTALKGSYGRVPTRAGRLRAQLTVAGVIGADLADVVLATSIASGPDPVEPTALPHWPVPPPRSRVLTVGFSADLGYARPDPAVTGLVRTRLGELAGTGAISLSEVAVELADPERAWLPLTALEKGRQPDPAELEHAYQLRQCNDAELSRLFSGIDVLVTPTTPQTAFPVGDYEANLPAGHLCWAFNLSGHPAVTVPAGLLDGLPVGLQAVAAPHRDDLAVWLAGQAAAGLPDPPAYWP
jgi:aspartyl-tRNA(Asn)/glutamyl-tRNA(Gln) amidotransferase subunit A